MLQSFKISVNWAKEDLLPLNKIYAYHNQYKWNLISHNVSNAATLFNKSNWGFYAIACHKNKIEICFK